MQRQFKGLDRRTTTNIQNIMALVREQDWDWLLVADGDERIGKTTLLILIMLTAEPKLNRYILNADYKKVLDRVAWTFDTMLQAVKTLPNGTVQLYDEASMLGREAMRDHNLRMVRVMSTIGIRNRLYLWTFPDFYMLDPYLRDGRVRTRAYVHTVQTERGHVAWYVRQRFPFPRPGGESVWWLKAYDSSFGSVPSLGPQHKEFWEMFREREMAAKSQIMEQHSADPKRDIALRLRKQGMSHAEIVEATGMSVGWVAKVLKGISPGQR